MNIREKVPLNGYTTMRLGGQAAYFANLLSLDELPELVEFAKSHKLPVFVLGGGSNTIFDDDGFKGLVIRVKIPGFEVIEDSVDYVTIKIGAGEIWDEVVSRTVTLGLSGIEALSAIPGRAGATPAQNVGAYGQEIANVLVNVEAFDMEHGSFVTLLKDACKFSYRNSIFKTTARGRYIITALTLKLSLNPMHPPFYSSLQKYLDEHGITDYSPASIRQAVFEIRSRKLPNPKLVANSGSFFQNPIITRQQFQALKQRHPDIPHFAAGDGFKVPAGWLIEQSDLKGLRSDHFSTYNLNALVITNDGQGTTKELKQFIKEIEDKVAQKFGIRLETEPQIID